MHPDKNPAPGADEAFKIVSQAFNCLSDPGKREFYDMHGSDPDKKEMPAPSFNGGFGPNLRRRGNPGAQYSSFEEVPPDILNFFFQEFQNGNGPGEHVFYG
jgi:DnaJ-class molecular chaperone